VWFVAWCTAHGCTNGWRDTYFRLLDIDINLPLEEAGWLGMFFIIIKKVRHNTTHQQPPGTRHVKHKWVRRRPPPLPGGRFYLTMKYVR
jgi:hypothetical protein